MTAVPPIPGPGASAPSPARRAAARLNRLRTWPVVGVAVRTVERAVDHGARDSAAAIAYYAFFALFPLLLALASVVGFALESLDLRLRVDELVADLLPGSSDLVAGILESVVRHRGSAGAVGILGLLWSASAAFGAVSRAVNRAWAETRRAPFYVSRLRYFGMVLGLVLLVVVWVLVTAAVEVMLGLAPEVLARLGLERVGSLALGRGVSFLFLLTIFTATYKAVPRHATRWAEVLPGALLAAVLTEVGKWLFLGYLESVADFEAVYGSLSSVIVLLLWLYYSGWVVILGAEFIAVRGQPPPTKAVRPEPPTS